MRRRNVSDDLPTIGRTAAELDRLLTAAEAHGARSAALVRLLVYNGLRIAEVLACDVDAFAHPRGHSVPRMVRKGGKASPEQLAPIVTRALEDDIGERFSAKDGPFPICRRPRRSSSCARHQRGAQASATGRGACGRTFLARRR